MNPKTPYQKMRENREKTKARFLREVEAQRCDALTKHIQKIWDMQDRYRQESMCHTVPARPSYF